MIITPKLTFVFDRKKQATAKKAAAVELRVSYLKKRVYMSTGIVLTKKEWSNGSVVGRIDCKQLNDLLHSIREKGSDIISQMVKDDCLDIHAIPRLIKAKISQSKTFLEYAREINQTRSAKLSEGTQRRYKVWFDFMEDWKEIVSFADVTERNIMKLDDHLAKKGLKESSRYNYHKAMKVFIRRAMEDGLLKDNPYVRLHIARGEDNGSDKFLTPNEFHRFEKCSIDNECLVRVRDLFVFQTYTMMSYTDLADFSYKDCTKMKGETIYKAKRNKTKQDFTIVIMKPALTILKKYKNKLPIISNVKYNLYLKAAVKYAKINKPVASHWARHTGATLMLNEGDIPLHVVQRMLGHASVRETERTYARLLDSTIVESISKYQKKKRK